MKLCSENFLRFPKVSGEAFVTISRFCSRPNGPKVLRGDGVVVITVHLKEHGVSFPKEAAAPERIIAVRGLGCFCVVIPRVLLPDLRGL